MASGRTKIVQFRRACPKFLRQTFHEWAQHSMKSCRWARAYYDYLRAGGKQHHAAIRALAFKWQRILFRCWKDQVPSTKPDILHRPRNETPRYWRLCEH